MNEPIAVLAAVAAAIAFGAADVIEQRATHTVPSRQPLDIRLFADLIRSWLWRAGITVDISASVMQRPGAVLGHRPSAGQRGHRLAGRHAAVGSRPGGRHSGLPGGEITQIVTHGVSGPGQLWPVYAFIILEPIGFLLNMNAFQESSLIAPVQAILSVTDPLVAIAIGVVWLNERLASAQGDIAGEVIGLIFMTAGVYALANRSPRVVAQDAGPLGDATVRSGKFKRS